MTGRSKLLVLLAAMMLVTAGCGGDRASGDEASGGDDVSEQGDDSQSSDGSEGSTDGGGGTDSGDTPSDGDGGAPELDPGSMPSAGEVVFEVDGQTFTIVADDMDYFICDIADDWVNVRSESETVNLTVQFDPISGVGNANVTPEGSEVRYDSFFRPDTTGGAAAEAPYVLYEGRFDTSQVDDLSDITDVGLGRVSVTCP